MQRLFWFLWRDPPPGSATRGCAASAAPRGCCATTAPRSPPTTRSRASRPRPPRRWRASPRGRAREASPRTRPRPSTLPRASPARPSSAASTQGYFHVLPRRSPGLAALRRPPHLLRQGDRRPRKRERGACRGPSPSTARRPAVTISSGPAEGSTSTDPSPSFGFASNEPDASFSCQLDGGGFEDCGSPFTASGLADGSHTFRVRATDRAGNKAPPPPAPGPSTAPPTSRSPPAPPPARLINERRPSVRLLLHGHGRQLQCRIDGAVLRRLRLAVHGLDARRTATTGSQSRQRTPPRTPPWPRAPSPSTRPPRGEARPPAPRMARPPTTPPRPSGSPPRSPVRPSSAATRATTSRLARAHTPIPPPRRSRTATTRFFVRAIDAAENMGDALGTIVTVDTAAPS